MQWLLYILRRIVLGLSVLLGVIVLTYLLGRFASVDPVLTYLASSEMEATSGEVEDERTYREAASKLGLDLPPFYFWLSPKHYPREAYTILPIDRRNEVFDSLSRVQTSSFLPRFHWFGARNGFSFFTANLFRGHLGYSLQSGQAVGGILGRAIRVTLPIALLGLCLAVVIGLVLGLHLGRHRWKWLRVMCYLLLSLPGIVLATLAIQHVAGRGRPFPGPGWLSAGETLGSWLHHASLPVLILAIQAGAYIALVLAASLDRDDRIPIREFARLRGAAESEIWWRDMLRLGLVPSVSTVVGLLIPAFLGGSVVIEYVFNIPGLGRTVLESILTRDWPLVLGVVLLSGVVTIIGYTCIDLLNSALDPRYRKLLRNE